MIKRKLSRHFIFLLAFLLLLSPSKYAVAQTIPPFRMQLTNGKMFSNSDLQKNKPVLLIYYAPDCEHCQALMKEIFQKYNNFKKLQIIMVTFEPLNYALAFEKSYHIKNYPNIISGVEQPTFYFRKYYNLMNTPFTALFDRRGKMVISYRKQTPVDDLISHIRSL